MTEQTHPLIKLESILSAAVGIGLDWSARRSELSIDEKSAGQFASNADLEIEDLIRTRLAQEFPGDAMIGEELGGDLSADQSGWAIDPIDGTSNFILGLPIWAISVGYIERGKSVLGAIAVPELGVTLSAQDGKGLRINGSANPGAPAPSSVRTMSLGENDYEAGAETDARAETLRQNGYNVVRYRCAVFSLAMSALGRLGGYVEHGCGLWDIAAAEVICREAGLHVSTKQIAQGRYAIDARWPA